MKKEETQLTPEEEFAKAFAEATTEEPAEGQSTDQPSEGKEEEGTEKIPQSEEETQAEESAPGNQESETDASANQEDETDYKALYEKEKQRTSSWEGRIKAANKKAEEAEQRAKYLESLAKAEEKKTPTSEAVEDEDLKNFFEEFPELEKPFNKLLAVKGEAIARKIVQEEIQKISPQINALQASRTEEIERQHWRAIETAHPDWKSYVDNGELQTWIDAQPSIIRDRLSEVTKAGSTGEVIELLDTFKKSKTPPSNKSTVNSKKAAAADAVPASSGGPPKSPPPKDDYDAAWEEAVRKRK